MPFSACIALGKTRRYKLAFPLTADFNNAEYWIGDQEPFKHGPAVTVFFVGEDVIDIFAEGHSLKRELEIHLKTFGSYLHPYAKAEKIPEELFRQLEQSSAACPVNYAFHLRQGSIVPVER